MSMPQPGETVFAGLGTWDDYTRMDRLLERSGYRVRFFHGFIEIMSISSKHEKLKSALGRLIEAYCFFADIDFQIWGSTTQKVEGSAAGEPDESYTFGLEEKAKPELVIEVGLTSGGIDKVAFWDELGAQEIWVWEKNQLHLFARDADGTVTERSHSQLLPQIPLDLLAEHALIEPSSVSVRAFRKRLEELR